MIEKGVIQVVGMKRCGRGYGRTYAAAMSKLEYAVRLLKEATPDLTPDERAIGVLPLLWKDGISEETVKALRSSLESL